MAEHCAKFPQYCDLIRAYDERYPESLSGPIQPTIEILRTLKQAGYPLYGLSNWPQEKFILVKPQYEFFGCSTISSFPARSGWPSQTRGFSTCY